MSWLQRPKQSGLRPPRPLRVKRRTRKPAHRQARLSINHQCVRCGHELTLEGWQINIWCEPIEPTYMPFPYILQRDCACGGHANISIALLSSSYIPDDAPTQ